MFPNLSAEMARSGITQKVLAEKLKMTPTTLSFKLNGKSDLTLKECLEIKKEVGTTLLVEELFDTKDNNIRAV